MAKGDAFRLTCLNCRHTWVGYPFDDTFAEACPECDSGEFEVGKEYTTLRIRDAFWVVLLIPNLLLFWN